MSAAMDELFAKVPDEIETIKWFYDLNLNPVLGNLVAGMCLYVAGEHPDWSYWKVLAEVKKKGEGVGILLFHG